VFIEDSSPQKITAKTLSIGIFRGAGFYKRREKNCKEKKKNDFFCFFFFAGET